MAYFLAPSADARPQFFTSQGAVLNGGTMSWFAAGTTTPQDTFTDSTGAVANANPITLDSAGRPPTGIYLTENTSYKLVVKDSAGNTIFTQDSIVGIQTAVQTSEWQSSGLTTTYIGATQFSVPGDQTTDLHAGRRVKLVDAGGTKYGTITASAFTTLTTVTIVLDSSTLVNPITTLAIGIIRADHPSIDIIHVNNTTSADGQYLARSSSAVMGSVYIDNPGRPNLLINPNWQIDQINEGALYTVNTVDVRGPDGWSGSAVGAGVFKLRTLTDPDNAALKCLEITCTTADAAIGAADDYFVYTAIEGYDATSLMTGTASAQAITVQFKYKTNVTGVYGVSVANSALNRRYVGIVTVADTSEHEYSVSLTLDTSGTWLYTSGVGCYLRLCLSAGSNFQTTAGAWAAGAEQTTSAQCNFMSANTNVAYLKRIQLIPGALVQAYRPADIQKELARAQRQYAKTFAQGTAPAQGAGFVGALECIPNAATNFGSVWKFPSEMRATPTITTYNPVSANSQWRDIGAGADRVASTGADVGSGQVLIIGTSAGAVNEHLVHVSASARLS